MPPLTPNDFIREYEQATRSHDLFATLNLIDDDAVYFFSNEAVHVGKREIEEVLKRNFESIRNEVYSIDHVKWLVEAAEVAVCVYDYSWKGQVNGKPASGSGRGTTALRRAGESWKVVHEHLSKGKFIG